MQTKKRRIDAGTERFTERTLRGVATLFKDTIFSSEYARLPGLMQKLDPRVKLATVLAVVVAISLLRRPEHILAMYVLTLALAAASRIPMPFFIKRVWLFIPIFSLAIALPALVMVPGRPIAHLATAGRFDINITAQGLESAVIFVLRVAASVSFVILLGLTTEWTRLLGALRGIGVPSFFVMILGITYRYIFVLLEYIEETHYARVSRAFGAADAVEGRRWSAERIGSTMSRTMRIGDNVNEAMVSRGFTGEARYIADVHPGAADAAWTAFVAAAVACLYLLGGFR
jgi:cobalt/nickel transport system permease protein